MSEHSFASVLVVGAVLHELAADAEATLTLASALEDRATGIASNTHPQKLRETAALLKHAALQLCQAAANLVGSAERLRIVAEFREEEEAGGGSLSS